MQLAEMNQTIAEAREVLADKDGTIEEKEQIVRMVTREKEALARENRVRRHKHLPLKIKKEKGVGDFF